MDGYGDRLAEEYFAHNRADVAGLDPADVPKLDAFLRGLVFTDGTVTRALEVQTLSAVSVEVVSQSEAALPEDVAHHLGAFEGDPCLGRRVRMKSGDLPLGVWAESWILADRLPGGFLGVLGSARQGIGQSMQGLHLESWRELLWFRLGRPPEWAGDSYAEDCEEALVRRYRVITGGLPAILIAESFAVEQNEGQYRLMSCADGFVSPPDALRRRRAGLGAA
ncbi:MAG: hypothetical protein QOC59_1677 [Microbacteriaceae bacterium]|nr:hypothetical protein [Microbacteriaceae bacterium]